MPSCNVIPLASRRPRRPGTLVRAEPGLVIIEAPGHAPQAYTAEQAVAVAHSLLTVAATARRMAAEARGLAGAPQLKDYAMRLDERAPAFNGFPDAPSDRFSNSPPVECVGTGTLDFGDSKDDSADGSEFSRHADPVLSPAEAPEEPAHLTEGARR